MTTMLDAASVETLTRSVMLGTARQAAPMQKAFGELIEPDDPKAAVKALALLGQHSRFRRPACPTRVSVEPMFPDERAIVPEAARPLLLSLFSGKGDDPIDPIPFALAEAMQRRHLRLHPFDLPRLDDFVKTYAEQLGSSAVAWTQRHVTTTTPDTYSFVETIDEANWMHGRPAQRAAFIRNLRTMDAVRARALIEGVFASEQAPVRLVLVKALAENLSPADQPFLEGLTKDRAPTVREAVESLLARLPGSQQAAKRLEECLSRIKRASVGVLRRRAVLQLDYPATVQEWQHEAWAISTFGTISLDDFAKGLELSIDEIVTAAADDQILSTVLAVQASQARRYDLLARLVRESAVNAWVAMVQSDDLDIPDPAAWSAAAIQPDLWPEMPVAVLLMRLLIKLQAPLSAPIAERLLASKAWHDVLDKAEQDMPAPIMASTIATLVPPSQREALRKQLAPLPADFNARALAAMTLLDLIEAA
jgi:Family of unknown function (DUF5691)